MPGIQYEGKQRPISNSWGDIYLCGDEYRIGDSLSGSPVKAETKHGRILTYLLGHVGEDVSYERLTEISGSINPKSIMTSLRCQMKRSRSFKFIIRPHNFGKGVRLEERL